MWNVDDKKDIMNSNNHSHSRKVEGLCGERVN